MATRITGLDIGSTAVRAVVLDAGFRGFELIEAVEERLVLPTDTPGDAPRSATEPQPDPSATVPLTGLEATPASDPSASHDAPPDVTSDGAAAVDDGEQPLISLAAREAIARLRDRGLLQSDVVVMTIGEESFYLTTLDLPFSGAREISAVLMPQLDGRLPEDVEDLHLDFMLVGKQPSGEHRLYAGGIQHSEMQRWMGLWQELGVDPRIVDVSPFHLFTAASWLAPGAPGEATAMLDLGGQFSRLVIYRDGRLELARTIHAGGDLITDEIAREFNLTPARAREGKHREAFVDAIPEGEELSDDARRAADACRRGLRPVIRDVRRTLQAHATETGTPVTRLLLSGGGSALGGLAEHLTQQLGVPTERVPLDRPELAAVPAFQELGHRFVTALGLALRGTSWQGGSGFNLRRAPYEFAGAYEYLTQRLPNLLGLAALVLATFVFFLFGRMALLKAEYRAVDDALAQVTREVFGSEVRDPDAVRSRLRRGTEAPALLPEHSAYDILAELSHAAGDARAEGHEITLTSLDVDLSRRVLRVTGTCNSAQAAEQYRALVEATPCAQRVRRTALSERSGSSDFTFTLEGEASCELADASGSAEGQP